MYPGGVVLHVHAIHSKAAVPLLLLLLLLGLTVAAGIHLLVPTRTPPCCFPLLLCSGADHRLAAWDALTLKEVWRTKLDAKAPLTSLTYSQR
jgi:hypothetical protein